MGKKNCTQRLLVLCFILLAGLQMMHPAISFGADAVCARVKIEIKQELTLERQAFDAHMRINNGLSHIILENVNVAVSFVDAVGNPVLASSDPANTDALFFIRLDSMENIENVSGAGTVDPDTSADIHWLIIPAPGSSNGLEQGTLYYVGASLTYTIGGEEKVTEVTPDYIFVKPMPQITLDYFLATDVYGDDAFTSEIEPPVPFYLGVRVKNNGDGVARNLKIDSAQPKIIENEQGLLIGFAIEGSEVNGRPGTDSLLADFGDIAPNAAGVARWIMTCTLSGQFVAFTAGFTHSDELGGELTSLIEAPDTHLLVRDVLVDLAGRDAIRDFLAQDGSVFRVYESDSTDTVVADQSTAASLQMNGNDGSLAVPPTAGFVLVQLADPFGGQKAVKEVIRSDGKIIKPDNIWLSKTRDDQNNWLYFMNLFDANTIGTYSVEFEDDAAVPLAPVLQFIPDKTRVEGQQLSFVVEASDPNGSIPDLAAAPLPAGAGFEVQSGGTAIFDWTPLVGQAGSYEIVYTASDGVLSTSQRALIRICSAFDTDCDQLDDSWELQHFGTLARDGYGDYDGDGVLDRDEFLNGTNPKHSNAPSTPEIFSPADKTEVNIQQPVLTINNSTDPDNDAINYDFQVYSDNQNPDQTVVSAESGVAEDLVQTSWTLTNVPNDNTWYFWRVKATDGMGSSKWAYGSFFVNTANDAPGPFAVSSPADDVEIDTVTPNLAVTNSTDVDEDVLTYAFMVASDSGLTDIVASVSGIPAGGNGNTSWVVSPSLVDNTWYYWKAIATDAHGASTATAVASFIVNTINSAPQPPAIFGPANEAEVPSTDIELVVYNAADADGDPLHYLFQIDTANTFDGTSKAGSEPIAEEGDGTTGWQFTGLQDETRYYWRVKTGDGFAESAWVVGNFFVNLANDSPSIPRLKNPADNAWVITTAPKLEVGESVDSDHDSIRYQFEVYDDDLNQLVASGESETPQWVVSQALQDSRWYRWKARAVDEHDAAGIWMTEARFYTDSSGINEVPVISVVSPVADVLTNGNFIQITWQDSDQDSSAWISLFYDTDAGGVAPILVVTGLQEDPDGDDDSYVWDISTMAGGRYYISAVISDGDGYDTSHAAGTVSIDRTAPVISASVPGGTYTVEQTVALTVNEEATIHFTLDGSEPGANSAIYTLPIEIAETATLKCAAVDSAGNWSSTLTEIYTIESENAAICDYTDPAARAPASGSGTQADPYVVTDCCALQGIADANGQYYVLGNDIDCSDTVTWNAGAGFIPLGGNGGLIYSGGGLDGQGHTISDVFINDALYTGLFARASNVAIKRLGLENANIIGTTLVGAVISNAYGGTSVNEVFATGSVSGSAATVGGLVGSAGTGFAIKDSYFSGQVSGSAVLGGLIGVATNTNGVENCYADATVTGTSHSVGGLIGNFGGTISPASISNSYATGTVDTGSYTFRVGGLVGYLAAGGSVINSYWFNNKAICIGQDLGVSSDCSEAIPDESQFFNNCNQPVLEWDFATAWGLDDSAADSSPCLRWQNCSFAEVCP